MAFNLITDLYLSLGRTIRMAFDRATIYFWLRAYDWSILQSFGLSLTSFNISIQFVISMYADPLFLFT